jgi:hypothetical protein
MTWVLKSRRSWARHAAGKGAKNGYTILAGKPEGKRPLGRFRHRWGNIKQDFRQTMFENMISIWF